MTGLSLIRYWNPEPLKSEKFTVKALKPGETRRVLFLHDGKGLAGSLLIRSDEKGPFTVKLEPWGVVTGRLLSAQGKPQSDVQIESRDYVIQTPEGVKQPPLDAGSLPGLTKVDKDGRFRVEGLVPGLKYQLDVMKGAYPVRFPGSWNGNLSVKSGETKDLGDVRIDKGDE
jgi:hypothetical protein